MSSTCVIQSRVDLCQLAMAARYFNDLGVPARSKSELLRYVLRVFVEQYVIPNLEESDYEAVADVHDALGILEHAFTGFLPDRSRGGLAPELTAEDREAAKVIAGRVEG